MQAVPFQKRPAAQLMGMQVVPLKTWFAGQVGDGMHSPLKATVLEGQLHCWLM